MKQHLFLLLFFSFLVISGIQGFAQGSSCQDLDPFCAGNQELVFPNSNLGNSDQVNGQAGPNYGCLLSQPYPAWFYLQIEESGDLRFNISQFQNENGSGSLYDVDFIVWGPFERTDDYCTDESLSQEKIVDCSYQPDAVEQMDILNAEAGQVYVVLITNYDELPGYISLEQTNSDQTNSGSTDCGILDEVLGEDRILCGEEETILDATTDGVEGYEWYWYNESLGDFQIIEGEEESTLAVTDSGRYKVIVYENQTYRPDEDEIDVLFYDKPIANTPEDLYICDPEQSSIDLTAASQAILEGTAFPEDYRVNFYESAQDIANNNPISIPQNFAIQETREILAIVEGLESGCVSESTKFSVNLIDLPSDLLPEESVICVDLNGNITQQRELGEDLGPHLSYEWLANGEVISTNPLLDLIEVPDSQTIALIITDLRSGCSVGLETNIAVYSKPARVSVEIEGSDFTGGYLITAEAIPGIGEDTNYQYRVDDGLWQEGRVFQNLNPGFHTISAREINGCGMTTSEEFYLMGYPRFFTPNADGYNDTWNIDNTEEVEVLQLYIFDRYGKLIKELSPGDAGWNGTYNGRDLPADDYWFKVEFEMLNGKRGEFGANFTLKR